MNHEILIVEDDLFLAESLKRLLVETDYSVTHVSTAMEAWERILTIQPNLALLDLGLPDQDGVTLCRRIRAKWNFPILMLTSRSQAIDKVLGLESGADDYLPKPFDPNELIARVRALLRRSQVLNATDQSQIQKVGDFQFDQPGRRVMFKGSPLELTETEYRILAYLATNSGRAISREQLFETIWGYEIDFNSNSLEVLIYRLRNKISQAGAEQTIKTLRGYGYKWET